MDAIGISLVIPIHNVASYLPDLLESLANQRSVRCRVEVVFVDDGSSDESADVVRNWMSASPKFKCRLIQQGNAGVSSARNAGLAVAQGEWVSFPDGDDILDHSYLRATWRFLKSDFGQRSCIVASRVLRYNEATGVVSDDHPLRFRFENGAQAVDMARHPDYFQLHAASTFFRRLELLASDVRFPIGVHASEDALMIARYLLKANRPVLGLNPEAKYLYRRRRLANSATNGYIDDPEAAYLRRFRDHYAELLDEAAVNGSVPNWLQSILLYELHWALAPWQRTNAKRPVVPEKLGSEILKGITDCSRHLDAENVMAYDATALSVETRLVLLALNGQPLPEWIPEHLDASDPVLGKSRWRRWVYSHDAASLPLFPSHAEDWARNIVYFAPTPLWEVYEWRDGSIGAHLTSRAMAADRSRRKHFGQQRVALLSRVSDMRVRRVRLQGNGVPLVAIVRWGAEATRRHLVSRARLIRMLADVLTARATGVHVISVLASHCVTGDVLNRKPTSRVIRISPDEARHRARSLGAALAVRRASSIVSDDPYAALSLLSATRPRASRWHLVLTLTPHLSHDDALAIAEGSVSAVVFPPVAGVDCSG